MNWIVEVQVPDERPSLPVGEQIGQALRKEADSHERVTVEIFHSRGTIRYGFFVHLEAADAAAAGADASLATARAYREAGLSSPEKYSISIAPSP